MFPIVVSSKFRVSLNVKITPPHFAKIKLLNKFYSLFTEFGTLMIAESSSRGLVTCGLSFTSKAIVVFSKVSNIYNGS